jgi:hypothetical protein
LFALARCVRQIFRDHFDPSYQLRLDDEVSADQQVCVRETVAGAGNIRLCFRLARPRSGSPTAWPYPKRAEVWLVRYCWQAHDDASWLVPGGITSKPTSTGSSAPCSRRRPCRAQGLPLAERPQHRPEKTAQLLDDDAKVLESFNHPGRTPERLPLLLFQRNEFIRR